ncbi:hypothetical protein I4Q36_07160 [Tuanshanicoccus lijuaniae]|nr:hypothetical protein [Aerococcaceae bacterium zg-1292]QQA36588.1 hypothetical protein I4Q36_07160 [Aerococcaceae bacterium zg-1292]
MKEKDEYDWSECEDDNRDLEIIKKAETMTIEEIDAKLERYFKDLKLESV